MMSNLKVFELKGHQVDSFDSYYKKVLFRKSTLVIPYINLGLIRHELNQSESKLAYFDFSYIVAKEVSYLGIYKQHPIIDNLDAEAIDLFFGGQCLDDSGLIDMDIKCKSCYLYLLPFSKSSDSLFIPHDTPNFKRNLDSKLVEDFFKHDFLPEEFHDMR